MEEEKNETIALGETQKTDTVSVEVGLLGPIVLLKQAWELYRERLHSLLGVMIVPVVLMLLFALLSGGGIQGSSAPFLVGVSSLLLVVIQILAAIALLYVIIAEQPIAVKEAYQKARSLFFPYLWISILVGAATMAGFILLIIPGIIFSVWFSLALLALVVEGKRGTEALKASRAYVKGHWWAVFGRLVSIIALVFAAMIALGLIAWVLSVIPGLSVIISDIGGALISLFLTPLILCYMYYLYKSVRSLKSSV